jgi:hypothetical protein
MPSICFHFQKNDIDMLKEVKTLANAGRSLGVFLFKTVLTNVTEFFFISLFSF